ncbi:hypothetical protein BH24GEM1_BH24GEM1_16520 [soil metagenome]
MRPQASDGSLVLVVDDDPLVRHPVARLLTDAGYVVLLAGDGEEGLAVTATLDDKLGLVVTDIRMPVLGGLAWRPGSGMRSRTSPCCSSQGLPR